MFLETEEIKMIRSRIRHAALLFVLCNLHLGAWAQPLELPLRGDSGEIILSLGELTNAAYSPDGRSIATCGPLGVFIWDVEIDWPIRWLRGHASRALYVAFSPDGSRVLTGSDDSTAKLRDAQTGEEIRTFPGHAVAFSPDGTQVLTGSDDKTAKLWDIETGEEIRTFSGHADRVESVAFSPDGSQVLTGSSDDTAKLWDTQTAQEFRTFSGHIRVEQPMVETGMTSVSFSPDGTRVLTGSDDGTARIWDISDLVETSGIVNREWTPY